MTAVFVLMVNISAPFAMACGRIPLLRELAAAVENEFVQPIEMEQTIDDITLRVEHVIVDQKQLNIFYTLNSPVYSNMLIDPSISRGDGTALEGYSLSVRSPRGPNGELRLLVADFMEGEVPESLLLTCRVEGAMFEFLLEFDPYYTQQVEMIDLNRDIIIDGQRLTIANVEIYPTHMRLNLEDDPSNNAWLKSLSLYVENEQGQRFEAVGNGISATGSPDSPMMSGHRLESAFFSENSSLSLYITGAVWLDKDMERVQVDLANGSALWQLLL